MMVGEPAGQRLLQGRRLAAHGCPGHVGQHLRIAFTGDQCGHHRPARHTEDVAGDDRQLDERILQKLFHALLLSSPGLDQIHPIAGQVPQLPKSLRRHKARPQHLPLSDLAQPHGIQPIGLRPTRQMLDVLRIDEPGLEPVFKHIKRRPPIVCRGLHHHPGHAQLEQPVGQLQQRPRHRRERPHLLRTTSTGVGRRDPDTADDLSLSDINRSDSFDQLRLLAVDLHHQHLRSAPTAT